MLVFKLLSNATLSCFSLESSANVLFIIFCNRFVDINKLKIAPTKAACRKKNFSLLNYLYLRVLSGLLIHPSQSSLPRPQSSLLFSQSHYQLLGTSRSSLFSLLSYFFSCVSWQQLKDALMSFKSIVAAIVVVLFSFCDSLF